MEILLVEDDPADVELIQEFLREARVAVHMTVVENGVKALDYLHRREPYGDVSRPDLILLDLNLPAKDGREVLSEIKTTPDLRTIPVLVLTTSEACEDIEQSYELGANCYLTKPLSVDQFARVVQCIENFWLTIVKLPSRPVNHD